MPFSPLADDIFKYIELLTLFSILIDIIHLATLLGALKIFVNLVVYQTMSTCQAYYICYQNVASPPPAAPAQKWKPKTANMNTFIATTAAAASVLIHNGSALLVSSIQQLDPDSGNR